MHDWRVGRLRPGALTNPVTRPAPTVRSASGSRHEATSCPSTSASAVSSRPLPLVFIDGCPSSVSATRTSGRASAYRRTSWLIAADSARGLRVNFNRAGIGWNRLRTQTVVPRGRPRVPRRSTRPARIPIVAARPLSSTLLATSTSATAAMLGSASPRNPSVEISSRSRTSSILLVAWRWNASSNWSGGMPWPSSATRISRSPPPSTSTRTSDAPASSALSTSSLTTETGRSTTSPAAIRSAISGGSTRIIGSAG